MLEALIKEFPNYKINCSGDVFSNYSGEWVEKAKVPAKGYLRVQLTRPDGTRQAKLIHRLVAQAFLLNPEDKPQVNHDDGDTTNNKLSNLEWATAKENEEHSYKVLGKKPNKTNLGNTGYKSQDGKEVHQYTMEGTYIQSFGSGGDGARAVNGSQGSLNQVLQGMRKSHKDFRWSYIKVPQLPSLAERVTTKKLSNDNVVSIKNLLAAGAILSLIATKFSVSKDTIRDIKHSRGAYK